jgi:hypothetical protein
MRHEEEMSWQSKNKIEDIWVHSVLQPIQAFLYLEHLYLYLYPYLYNRVQGITSCGKRNVTI